MDNKNDSMPYVQEIKKSEISVKHEATITLPKNAVIELSSQNAPTSPTINIPSGHSFIFDIPSNRSVTIEVPCSPLNTIEENIGKPVNMHITEDKLVNTDVNAQLLTMNVQTDQKSDISTISKNQLVTMNILSDESDKSSEKATLSDITSNTAEVNDAPIDASMNVDSTNESPASTENEGKQQVSMNTPTTTDEPKNQTQNMKPALPVNQDEKQKKFNKVTFQKYPEARLENDMFIVGTLDPGFEGTLRGTIPVDATHVWVYTDGDLFLINTENGREETYTIPNYSLIKAHIIPGFILMSVDDGSRSLYKINEQGEGEDMFLSLQNSTVKTIRDVICETSQTVIAYAFSRSGEYFIMIVTKTEQGCCVPKSVQYIQKYKMNGELVLSNKLQEGRRNMMFHYIKGMELNFNEDICIAGYEHGGYLKSILAVFTKDFIHKFSVQNEAVFCISVDPWHNIVCLTLYNITIYKSDGRVLKSFGTKFGENKAKHLSVDEKGEYAWIYVENENYRSEGIVIIAYSSSLDKLNLPISFREIC